VSFLDDERVAICQKDFISNHNSTSPCCEKAQDDATPLKRSAPRDPGTDSPAKKKRAVKSISDSIHLLLKDPWNSSESFEERGWFLYWLIQSCCRDSMEDRFDELESTVYNRYQAKHGVALEMVYDVDRTHKLSDKQLNRSCKGRVSRLYVYQKNILEAMACLVHIKYALTPEAAVLVDRLIEATQDALPDSRNRNATAVY